jgi:hypothetical protein
MAKRKQTTAARKNTASKRAKVRSRVKSSSTKAAKRTGRNTSTRKVAKRAAAKIKGKKPGTKPRAKRPVRNKIESPREPTEIAKETLIFDIIEEPAPGVVTITEFDEIEAFSRQEGVEGSRRHEDKEEGA